MCDKVWFVKPNGKMCNDLITKVSKVVMKQENLKNGRIMKCETFLYDFNRYSCSVYEEELFSSEEELINHLEEDEE